MPAASLDLQPLPPDGVLFDMDGTLLTSAVVVERAWGAFADRHGLDADALIAGCHGIPVADTVRAWLPDATPDAVAAECRIQQVMECADVDGIVALPGAADLLASLDASGIPWAIVTSADEELARVRLAAAGLPTGVLVTADRYSPGKPAPDGFWLGARELGVPIDRCWVVEDSPAGLAAARASGGTVVDVGPGGTTLPLVLDALRGPRP